MFIYLIGKSYRMQGKYHFQEESIKTLWVTIQSSILAWRNPGTEEPGGLPSMGLHRVGHDWSDLAAAAAAATSYICIYANQFINAEIGKTH